MFMSEFRMIRLLPLASLVLAACSVHPPVGPGKSPDSPQWLAHRLQVKKITQFQTRGAFAYLSDKQKVYARFNWQQNAPDRYRLLLTNPLGSTQLDLNVQPNQIQLTDNNGKHYIARDAETMLQKLTGIPIPLNSLRQWILGLPGDATDYKLDNQYHLREVNYTQDNKTWKVTYSDYDTKIQPPLPSNMELHQGEQRIKLKMDSWVIKS